MDKVRMQRLEKLNTRLNRLTAQLRSKQTPLRGQVKEDVLDELDDISCGLEKIAMSMWRL